MLLKVYAIKLRSAPLMLPPVYCFPVRWILRSSYFSLNDDGITTLTSRTRWNVRPLLCQYTRHLHPFFLVFLSVILSRRGEDKLLGSRVTFCDLFPPISLQLPTDWFPRLAISRLGNYQPSYFRNISPPRQYHYFESNFRWELLITLLDLAGARSSLFIVLSSLYFFFPIFIPRPS